jgi:isoleucyl-tRNA synthetase
MNDDTISHIQKMFRKFGTDFWWSASVEELLPPKYKDKSDEVRHV